MDALQELIIILEYATGPERTDLLDAITRFKTPFPTSLSTDSLAALGKIARAGQSDES